jgi:hypothetical protein
MMLFLALVMAAAAPVAPPALPEWMAGCWEQRSGDKWTEECWTAPKAGIMLGSGRSGTGEALRDWEAMQILRVDTDDPAVPRMTFYGAPGGQNRTPFTWVASDGQSVTFVNEGHDYPQRIRYWREGRELVAEIALKDGSKAASWRYKPMGD